MLEQFGSFGLQAFCLDWLPALAAGGPTGDYPAAFQHFILYIYYQNYPNNTSMSFGISNLAGRLQPWCLKFFNPSLEGVWMKGMGGFCHFGMAFAGWATRS